MIRTQIQVQKEQLQWLKGFALKKGISMSQVIRDSVDHYRRMVEKTAELSFKKKNALKAIGSFSSKDKTS